MKMCPESDLPAAGEDLSPGKLPYYHGATLPAGEYNIFMHDCGSCLEINLKKKKTPTTCFLLALLSLCSVTSEAIKTARNDAQEPEWHAR